MEDKSIMDCAVKNLEKTFDIKRKALVNKLHNMQWLKNTSHSSNPEKINITYKHIQDHDKNNKLEDKSLLAINIKPSSVEESGKHHSINTYERYLSNDVMPESDETVWNKDVNSSNMFPNSKKLVNQKDEEDMLMHTKSIVTAKLDAQFYTNKMQKDQSNMSQSNAEDITQEAVCSNLSNFEIKSNKTADMEYENKKDRILRKQQTVSKLSMSKMQESLKKNTSMPNCAVYKNKTFENTEKVTNASKNSDLLLNEAEKRNKKIIDGKHFQHHPKADRDFNLKRSTAFAVQYKNSTFTKPMQNKDALRSIEYTSIYERNLSYNYPKFHNEHIGNAKHNNVIKREYIHTNVFSKSNVRTGELCTNNLENRANQQNEMSRMQSTTDVKLTTVYKKDTLACNDRNNINLVNAKTSLTENKKCTNLSIDNIRKQEPILGQCHEEMKRIDKSKADIDQQNIEINNAIGNEQINLFKQSSNLLSNKCSLETPVNVIHQHSLKLENTQHVNVAKKLGSNQIALNNRLSNTAYAIQKNATTSSQQSISNMRFNVQQTVTQAKDQTKQMPSWESNNSKFCNQHFSVNNAIRPMQTPNAFNVALYESNVQGSNDGSANTMLETAMNCNKGNSNVLYKFMPNIQQRSDTFSNFKGHSILSDQTNKNSSIQDSFHVDPYNTMGPTIIHNYSSGAFDSDNFNNTHIMKCLSHPIIYASSLNVQTRNPQLQYPLPVLYNSPCTSYSHVIPNTTNQSNNSNSIGFMYDEQFKYVPCMQMNNYIRDTDNDLSNCTLQARNAVDNVPMKFNQHYKKCQDNSQIVYNLSRHVTPLSYSRSQQDMNFMPTIAINQYSNSWQTQKHNNQNVMNYMQITKYPKQISQTIQDLSCDDNESENIPPLISPKEFITNNKNFSYKIDQFATRV